MRESIGATWTIQAMIFFILIFAAFLSLVIQYSKAYLVKNEVLSIIEKYEGGKSSQDIIGSYVSSQGYKTKASCSTDEGWYGATDYNVYEKAEKDKKYLFCLQKQTAKNKKTFYNVEFFYKFNLPLFGDIVTFRIVGNTKTFKGANTQLI